MKPQTKSASSKQDDKSFLVFAISLCSPFLVWLSLAIFYPIQNGMLAVGLGLTPLFLGLFYAYKLKPDPETQPYKEQW